MLISRLRATEAVEVMMACLEDLPELGLAVIFIALGGLEGAEESDISLFATSALVSLFHAGKCGWSKWKHSQIIDIAKAAAFNPAAASEYNKVLAHNLAGDAFNDDVNNFVSKEKNKRWAKKAPNKMVDLHTYDGYFTAPKIYALPEGVKNKPAAMKQFAARKKACSHKAKACQRLQQAIDEQFAQIQSRAEKESDRGIAAAMALRATQEAARKKEKARLLAERRLQRQLEAEDAAADANEGCPGLVHNLKDAQCDRHLKKKAAGVYLIRRSADKLNYRIHIRAPASVGSRRHSSHMIDGRSARIRKAKSHVTGEEMTLIKMPVYWQHLEGVYTLEKDGRSGFAFPSLHDMVQYFSVHEWPGTGVKLDWKSTMELTHQIQELAMYIHFLFLLLLFPRQCLGTIFQFYATCTRAVLQLYL